MARPPLVPRRQGPRARQGLARRLPASHLLPPLSLFSPSSVTGGDPVASVLSHFGAIPGFPSSSPVWQMVAPLRPSTSHFDWAAALSPHTPSIGLPSTGPLDQPPANGLTSEHVKRT